jgi:hypothetical protein
VVAIAVAAGVAWGTTARIGSSGGDAPVAHVITR